MGPAAAGGISAIINVVAAIVGEFAGMEDREEANRLAEQKLSAALGINLPDAKELVAIQQGKTNLGNIQTDGALDAYQDEAQGRLAEIGRSGGLDAQARGRLAQTRMEGAQQERSQREAILSEARQRGTLGSGAETSALLQSQQAGADRAAMSDVQTLSDAEQRAMSAILASGNMAAARQSTQFNQRAQVASAQDEIDRFNASTSNNFQLANAQRQQQQFQNQLSLTAFQNNARATRQGELEDRAQHVKDVIGGVGQAAGYAVGAMGQAMPTGGASMQTASMPLGTDASYQGLNSYLAQYRRRAG